ncbi:hypothetical protein [Palaeococcus sp. (in: euryarchaeotes)]|uniref:hypothetical protein n=1 Tax=Palaeococcus sp. (in: euryarchaeotes) TaxID=2820298 RepID=UPI0025DCE7CD|nr:hypothetical protein [Palaeococcus sp. (in: euryarchaeotes)]
MALELTSPEAPEDLESIGRKKITQGDLKEGVGLLIKAAKKYEGRGENLDAARTYRHIASVLLSNPKLKNKARPFLLKAASLYIDLISEEIERFEINLFKLEDFCINVIESFALLGDREKLEKYAKEFARMYEELAETYMDTDEIDSAIIAYESAYRYYKFIDAVEDIKSVAGQLIDLYGKISKEYLDRKAHEKAADTFLRIAYFVKDLFGYDAHYMEMAETAAKNYETASKLAYAEGNLDKTTSILLKAQYAYLLAGNTARAKLIGINLSRMLYQVINNLRSHGNYERAYKKMVELAQAILGLGKLNEAIRIYKNTMEEEPKIGYKLEMRLALLKYLVAEKKDAHLLENVEQVEFYIRRGNLLKAFDIAQRIIERQEGLEDFKKKLYEAEGITSSF